jgi:hypothetical protein
MHRIKAGAIYWGQRKERVIFTTGKNFKPFISRTMQNQLAVTRTPDFQRKKQAIHFALCTVLTQEEAAGAINSWVQHISASTSLFSGLNLFARKVCKTYGKDSRHVELAQAMSLALMSRNVEPASNHARPVPVEAVNESGSDLSGPEIGTPEFASFQPLLLALLHEVTERDVELGRSCREFLLNVVDNLPWSPAQQGQVINLINTGSTVQIRPYRAGQLNALMHHFAVWMKDMLGDETAAILFQHAIDAVEQSDAAMAYSPRKFFSK